MAVMQVRILPWSLEGTVNKRFSRMASISSHVNLKKLDKDLRKHGAKEKQLREKMKLLVGTRVRVCHPEFPNIERFEILKEHNPDQYQKVLDAGPWPWTGTIKTFGMPLGNDIGGDVCVIPDNPESLGKFWLQKLSGRYGWIDCEMSWLELL